MNNYYNENDPKAAAWLRELISAGEIAPGHVDERSISDVLPSDLAGYAQCHFFAGIGGWSVALRLAGVPDDAPLWTGSCPCQPFSAAGKRQGASDERHLWPHWFHLLDQCRPAIVLGEQVASKDGLEWLDLVSADLEGAGYAFAAADMCAAGIGAPHIRQRLWFVGLADADHAGLEGRGEPGGQRAAERFARAGGVVDGMEHTARVGRIERGAESSGRGAVGGCGGDDQLFPGPTDGFWRDADWLGCRDDRWRPVEPGTFPLAHGLPERVGLLRGYGNAIVPQVAATFIGAALDL